MAEFASKGLAGTALGTGIGGLALGVLNGGLGNILNGIGGGNPACSDDHCVNRYEAAQQARISELETEAKLRDANTYAMAQVNNLRDYVDRKFDNVEHEICDQKVYNATSTAAMSCMAQQIAQLQGITKIVIPNTSVCPGWGNVTITPAAAPTTTP